MNPLVHLALGAALSTNAAALNTVAPNTVAPNAVAPNTVAPNTVAPNTVAPNTVAPNAAPDTAAPDTNAERAYYRTHISIDTKALLKEQDAKAVGDQTKLFEGDIPGFFGEAVPRSDATANDVAEVLVKVSWADFARFEYEVAVEVTTPDGQRNDTSFRLQGDEYDVLARFREQVPTILPWLEQPPSDDAAVPPVSSAQTQSPPTQQHDDRKAPRFWIAAGIGTALAAGGIGAIVFGGSRLAKGNVTAAENDGLGRNVERHTKQGITWTVIGAGATITGAALIAVDLTVLWKRRKARTNQLSLAPWRNRETTGLTLQGRF